MNPLLSNGCTTRRAPTYSASDGTAAFKFITDVFEQYHRFIRKKVRASQSLESFHKAERTLEGSEAGTVERKGQVKRFAGVTREGRRRSSLRSSGPPLSERHSKYFRA